MDSENSNDYEYLYPPFFSSDTGNNNFGNENSYRNKLKFFLGCSENFVDRVHMSISDLYSEINELRELIRENKNLNNTKEFEEIILRIDSIDNIIKAIDDECREMESHIFDVDDVLYNDYDLYDNDDYIC